MLPIYKEKNAMGVNLGENANGNLKCLNYAITALKLFSKTTYASWTCMLKKVRGSRAGSWWRPCYHIVSLVSYFQVNRKMD